MGALVGMVTQARGPSRRPVAPAPYTTAMKSTSGTSMARVNIWTFAEAPHAAGVDMLSTRQIEALVVMVIQARGPSRRPVALAPYTTAMKSTSGTSMALVLIWTCADSPHAAGVDMLSTRQIKALVVMAIQARGSSSMRQSRRCLQQH